jgi:hypothetical protein
LLGSICGVNALTTLITIFLFAIIQTEKTHYNFAMQ